MKENEIMGISTRKPGKHEQGKQMSNVASDVSQAKFYIQAIGGGGKVYAMIGKALDKLNELFPHKGEPEKQWTERRLRAWWNHDTDIVRHWQMIELHAAASKAKEERELFDKARKEYADFIQKTARIATFLEHTDPDFFGAEIERLGRQTRQLDRAGD
jgi:hypothetical protein